MTTAASERERLLVPVNLIVGGSERLLAEAKTSAAARVVLDLRKIHDAGRRLHRIVVELGGGGTASRPGAVRHELNNALNHVLGYSELLREDAAAAPLVADLARIAAAAQELRSLVNLGLLPADALTLPDPPVAASISDAAPVESGSVLVVDDDPGNRDLITRCLAPHGHEVLTMEHGRWALEILESERVDVILLDLAMPEMNGYETLVRLKADPRLVEVPVVVVSGTDDLNVVVRCLKLGAEDFLPKPFDPVRLAARVAACITRKRARERELRDLADVGRLTAAAAAVEDGTFAPAGLDPVAARTDDLGRLARVFQRLARGAPTA